MELCYLFVCAIWTLFSFSIYMSCRFKMVKTFTREVDKLLPFELYRFVQLGKQPWWLITGTMCNISGISHFCCCHLFKFLEGMTQYVGPLLASTGGFCLWQRFFCLFAIHAQIRFNAWINNNAVLVQTLPHQVWKPGDLRGPVRSFGGHMCSSRAPFLSPNLQA